MARPEPDPTPTACTSPSPLSFTLQELLGDAALEQTRRLESEVAAIFDLPCRNPGRRWYGHDPTGFTTERSTEAGPLGAFTSTVLQSLQECYGMGLPRTAQLH